LAGDKTGNGDGGKSDGDDNKVGWQATASNGEGGRRLTATRAMAMVTAMTWVMAMVNFRQQQGEFCYLVQNGKIGPNHDGLYPAQMA